jgi:hypothetical protein
LDLRDRRGQESTVFESFEQRERNPIKMTKNIGVRVTEHPGNYRGGLEARAWSVQ